MSANKSNNNSSNINSLMKTKNRSKSAYPVAWDRKVVDVQASRGSNAEATTQATLHSDGSASVAVALDAKALAKSDDGQIAVRVPSSAVQASVQLIDASDATWAPVTLRFGSVSGVEHAHDVAAFVGHAVTVSVAGVAEPVSGVIEAVSDKCVVLAAPASPAAPLHLLERSKITACSLPGLATLGLVVELGPVGDSLAPVLLY